MGVGQCIVVISLNTFLLRSTRDWLPPILCRHGEFHFHCHSCFEMFWLLDSQILNGQHYLLWRLCSKRASWSAKLRLWYQIINIHWFLLLCVEQNTQWLQFRVSELSWITNNSSLITLYLHEYVYSLCELTFLVLFYCSLLIFTSFDVWRVRILVLSDNSKLTKCFLISFT